MSYPSRQLSENNQLFGDAKIKQM